MREKQLTLQVNATSSLQNNRTLKEPFLKQPNIVMCWLNTCIEVDDKLSPATKVQCTVAQSVQGLDIIVRVHISSI